jgi:hypothetical protein
MAAKRRKKHGAARRNQNRAGGTSRAEPQRRRERPRRNALPGFLCASAPLREKIFAGMRDSDGLQCRSSFFCAFCAFLRLFIWSRLWSMLRTTQYSQQRSADAAGGRAANSRTGLLQIGPPKLHCQTGPAHLLHQNTGACFFQRTGGGQVLQQVLCLPGHDPLDHDGHSREKEKIKQLINPLTGALPPETVKASLNLAKDAEFAGPLGPVTVVATTTASSPN